MNKVVMITGAARRMGAAIARYFHSHQYNVVIHYHHSLQEATCLAHDFNQICADSAITVQADLCDANAYTRIVDAGMKQWGRIDALIHSASVFHHTPFRQATFADWDLMLTANLKACYFLSQTAAPYLIESNGCIVHISDIFADIPKYEHSIYSLTKAALNSLTKSLAQELAPQVRVNAIAPGDILPPNTNRTVVAVPRMHLLDYEPGADDIAEAVYFAATHRYLTGQVIAIDGGKSINKASAGDAW